MLIMVAAPPENQDALDMLLAKRGTQKNQRQSSSQDRPDVSRLLREVLHRHEVVTVEKIGCGELTQAYVEHLERALPRVLDDFVNMKKRKRE